jgi:heterodisulfide reductase subunit A
MSEEKSVLVIGGGISGIQASLDLAEQGYQVNIVEKMASIGGKMALLDKTFPTMDCAVCILAPKMIETSRHHNINIITYSEVKAVEGESGDFTVKVWLKPRGVNPETCFGCGQCNRICPARALDQFNENLMERKAIYRPFAQAVPNIFTIDYEACIRCRACERVCPVNAIDVDDPGTEIELNVDAIIIATGLETFNPSMIQEYGYGRFKNVITAIEMERMLSATGCTSGELIRLSDEKHPHNVTFLHCVGSRSMKEGYPYCSSVCCMHATKEGILVKEHIPDAKVSLFYTDIRAFGKEFRSFVNRAQGEYGLRYIRAKPAEVREDPDTGNLHFWYENTLTGEIDKFETELLILCTALIPSKGNPELASILGVDVDEYGFFVKPDPILAPVSTTREGIYACGFCQGPKDIPDAITEASGVAGMVSTFIEKAEVSQ